MRANYIYQTIHTVAWQPLFVEQHCRLLEESFVGLYFRPLLLDAKQIEREIEELLCKSGVTKELSVFVELRVDIELNHEVVVSEISIYNGYVHRLIKPVARTINIDSPFGFHPSTARRSMISFANEMAYNQGGEIAIECDNRGEACSAGGATIFGIIDKDIICSQTVKCVEREFVLNSALECGLRVVERPIMKEELSKFEELLLCDHYGVTSISQCDQRRYLALVAKRIADNLAIPWE